MVAEVKELVEVVVMTRVQVRARMLDTLVQPVVWSYGEQLALDPQVGGLERQ